MSVGSRDEAPGFIFITHEVNSDFSPLDAPIHSSQSADRHRHTHAHAPSPRDYPSLETTPPCRLDQSWGTPTQQHQEWWPTETIFRFWGSSSSGGVSTVSWALYPHVGWHSFVRITLNNNNEWAWHSLGCGVWSVTRARKKGAENL